MKNNDKIGIWMNHSMANLMEMTDDSMETKTIESKFTHQEKEHSFRKSESLMHHKEQHEQSDFYKKIGEIIKGYKSVVLFGPTTAKEELANLLKNNHLFEKIEIVVKNSDKMTTNQQHAFVKEFFNHPDQKN